MAARFKLYTDKRGHKQPGIYEDADGWKFLRVRKGKWDSFIALNTQSIIAAIDFRDARRTAETAAKLGLAVDPNEAAKLGEVTVSMVIKQYMKDGYPNKKGIRRVPKAALDKEGIDSLSSDHIMAEARDLHARWPSMPVEARRKIVEVLVKKITVGKGKIDINLYYLPPCEEMTIKQGAL